MILHSISIIINFFTFKAFEDVNAKLLFKVLIWKADMTTLYRSTEIIKETAPLMLHIQMVS